MKDRHIGYIALVFIGLFIVSIVVLLFRTILQPVQKRVIVFDTVGSLKIEDPIMVGGIVVGTIVNVEQRDNRAFVTYASDSAVTIHADYSISIIDIGVMGDRIVVLDCGSPLAPVIPAADTLRGAFKLGPSEAIGMAYQMRETVNLFARTSTLLLQGSKEKPSLVSRIQDVVFDIDSISRGVLSLTRVLELVFSQGLDSASAYADRLSDLSDEARASVPRMLADLDTTIGFLDTTLARVEPLITGLNALAARLQGAEGRELELRLAKLQTDFKELRTLMDLLRRQGLKLRVWPF